MLFVYGIKKCLFGIWYHKHIWIVLEYITYMPNFLWGKALRHATYLINRINRLATRSLKGKKPYEPLRVFGCVFVMLQLIQQEGRSLTIGLGV